jgi:hypothetical protein
MNVLDLFFWAPFSIGAAALVIYVLVSIPYWREQRAEQRKPVDRPTPVESRRKTPTEVIEEIRQLVTGQIRMP